MSRYDGLIIPRSYSDYINKTDAATLSQALQLSGVMDNAPTAGSSKPVKSNGLLPTDIIESGNMTAVTSNGVYKGLVDKNVYGYIPLLRINRLSINIGNNYISATLLNQFLGGRIGGGITIIDITGTFANTATMICNCVSEYGTNNIYGYGIVISYYSGLQKFKLDNGTWTSD